MTKKTFQNKLKTQIIRTTFTAIVVFDLLFVSLTMFFSYTNNERSLNAAENEFTSEIEEFTNIIDTFFDTINSDEKFLSYYETESNPNEVYQQLYTLNNSLDSSLDLVLYTDHIIFNSISKEEIGLLHQQYINIEVDNLKEIGNSRYLSFFDTDNNYTIIGQKLVNNYYCFIHLDNDSISKHLVNSTSDNYIIYDRKNQVISTSNFHFMNELHTYDFFGQDNVTVGSTTYITRTTNIGNGYSIISMITQTSKVNVIFIISITIGFSILTGLLLMYYSRRISQKDAESLNLVLSGIDTIIAGNTTYRFNLGTEDEFSTIGQNINTMLDTIDELNIKNMEMRDIRNESEIKMLEAEFNPHFLFNTLETIKYSIYMDKDMAAGLIVKLNKLLRYSINASKTEVTLGEELEYLDYYLQIAQTRFEERFTYKINLDKEAENIIIPKLLIQPLVENAIRHNFQLKDTLNLNIDITKSNHVLNIIIADNGDGIESKKLEELRTSLTQKQSSHIGVYNVYRLLSLIYEDNFTFDIQSNRGSGTKISISIKGYKYV